MSHADDWSVSLSQVVSRGVRQYKYNIIMDLGLRVSLPPMSIEPPPPSPIANETTKGPDPKLTTDGIIALDAYFTARANEAAEASPESG